MTDIKSIWENHKPAGNIIIRTRIEIPHLNCYAATNNITGQLLYIMSISGNIRIPDLKNYRFQGVEIFSVELENTTELNIYLLENDLKDIFSLFIQNILDDILGTKTESEALTNTFKVVAKWKKLFDKISFNGLNIEQQKGLCGELLFINWLLDNQKKATDILGAWTGPDFTDKDFVFNVTGVEVKLTSAKHPKIKITSERQLDTQNLQELYLILYTAEEVKQSGFTLNSLVAQIREKISASPDDLKFFNEKLLLTGYLEEDTRHYNQMYSLKQIFNFAVGSEFPRITKDLLPLGIYDTSYSIEISAAESFITNPIEILQKFY